MVGEPVPSSVGVSVRMQRQRRKDTGPELALRKLLHADGYRYRVGIPVPGLSRRTIDIAFTAAKVAVFVDGCFWHGCPEHPSWPAANAAWWRTKIEMNRDRDRATSEHLTALGWTVVRVWEHENPVHVVARVKDLLSSRRVGGKAI